VLLLEFSAHFCSVLPHLGTLQEEHVYQLPVHDTDELWQRLVATWAEFQHSVVYDATDQWRKRLEACIHAEGGHFEHLLRHCLPGISIATCHNQFFSEPPTTTHNWLSSEPPTFEGMQQSFSQMTKFCISQVSLVAFSGGVGKWVTVCFLLR